MNTKHILSAALLVCAMISCSPKQDDTRVMRYYPDGRDIVCYDGDGRYNRALYGTYAKFRLETSDTPIFAAFGDKGHNIRFYLVHNGKETQLDLAEHCKAAYQGGRRVYTLTDSSWGDAQIEIYAMASFFRDNGALWRFKLDGFDSPVTLIAKMRNMTSTKFNRNGDLGVDPRENFEPAPGEAELQELDWMPSDVTYCFYDASLGLYTTTPEEGKAEFEKEEAARQELVNRVEINTPDPFFNTLGATLVAAADGNWDGKTILHGAIGWRTQLAGWRGAYVCDALGWNDWAISHYREYAKSMVTDVPPVMDHPQQSDATNLASGLKEWGTPMYSNGYITRRPGVKQMHHYDMNLNYIDELMWHFCYDADPEFMREMWPYIKLHHEWEKRNFDPDGDHLYDAYCCIWASDALYYNAGAVTHSSAYNYRSNLLTARIAELIGEDPEPYRKEAEAILAAMNERLWMDDLGYWAEYQDLMGLKRLHKSAAIWSIYTPIDCGACTPEQAYQATRYVDRDIPHIPVRYSYDKAALKALGLELPKPAQDLFTVSTTNWHPYNWSTNNVAHEEVANMALAYLQAGRNDSGFQLLKADLIDEMYLGQSPGNLGQISYYDKARSEAYRDFADNVGITSRAIMNGLFGILPDALNGQCVIKPAFPEDWNEVSIKAPHISYSFRREGNKDIYEIEQNFTRPLQIVVRANAGGGAYLEVKGTDEKKQTIVVDRTQLPEAPVYKEIKPAKADVNSSEYIEKMGLSDISRRVAKNSRMVDISKHFNSNADDIFKNEYISPRPPYTSLQLPKQGVGEWCIPHETHEIEDNGLRALVKDGVWKTETGLSFLTPAEGHNIIYTSLWDNYPDEVSVELDGKARYAYLLMAGTTQNMQSRIENGVVTVKYKDGSTSELILENPINWAPIEQDYYVDEYAFWTAGKTPYRVIFDTGDITREVRVAFTASVQNDMKNTKMSMTDRNIPNGAGTLLKMPLDKGKELESLTVTTLSNDVVIGLMAVTLEL